MLHPATLKVHSIQFNSVNNFGSCSPRFWNLIGLDRDMDRQPLKRQRSQDHENPDPLELEEWIILQKAKRLRIGL
jgi:hypothetical protein